ncbi:MAG: sulfate reduction electron transfer complex DsrMKJOP subunit DsrP [Candidatus Kryptoniota bacterium]
MLEYAFKGSKKYWFWLAFLCVIISAGFYFYLKQLSYGLGITGMSRDVSWGLYIAQFTFIVGIAASAVMVVLPYYLHNYRVFSRITILGEFLAISSVVMCITFVFVDLGQPSRVLNIFFYPTPHSLMFWDVIALGGYLILNIIITRVTLGAEYRHTEPARWIRPVIIISIPWAVSIHTVTAFLFAGLAGRPFWLTAILAPRFLASAFSAGPALLIVLSMIVKKIAGYDVNDEAMRKLSLIVTYAMCINVFLILMELFTTLYGGIPEDVSHLQFLYTGLGGNRTLVPWMWTSSILALLSLILLITPASRNNNKILFLSCLMVFFSIWIDKGLGLVIAGFIPSQFGSIVKYWPTLPESFIALGIWGIGAFLITAFYKIAISIRQELKV